MTITGIARKPVAWGERRAAASGYEPFAPRLQSLRASGEKLAALAADLKERAAHRGAASAGVAAGGEVDSQVAESLVDVGLIDPVTKRNAGKQYQQQLARQLADFLAPVLRRDRGMMVLHDIYCLFNRCAASVPVQVLLGRRARCARVTWCC